MKNRKDPKPKKPIYKRVWFWIVIILFTFCVFGSSLQNKNSSDTSFSKHMATKKEGTKRSSASRKTNDDDIQSMIMTISKKSIKKQEKLKDISVVTDSLKYEATGGTNNKRWEVSGELTQPNDNHVYSFFLTITFTKDILNKNTSLNGIEYTSDVIKVIY